MRTEEFKLRLKNDEFPALPHPLAQSLLEKLSKKEYEERYNVSDALKHPWITRNEADEIPLSIHESYKGFDSTNEVSTVTTSIKQDLQIIPDAWRDRAPPSPETR